MLGATKIEWMSVETLIPYAKNARTHSDEQVAQIAGSIKEFGFNNPVLVDKDNSVIAGHGRLMAARKLGMDKVPVVQLGHMTEAQRKAYVLADNRIALNSGWDAGMLSLELQDLKDDIDLSLLGFDPDELDALLNPIEETEGLTDEDAVPDVPDEPKTKLGDIYLLGNHRLMCGDSTSIDSVEKLMDGQLADQLVTDPPYNIAYEGGSKKRDQIKNDEMADEEFRQFLKDVYIAANAVMKAGAVFYIWHADTEGYNFRGAARDMGWKVRQTLIWNKDNSAFGRSDYHWKHEPCLYGWKEGAAHLWAADRKQTTVIQCKRPSKSELHPTMKPVELMEYQILNNTKGSDIVLDLFGGSGSTMIAAEKTGRKSCLMELDPKYCDVIVQRWEEFTGKKAVLSELEKA
jgi:site-specific DNA-methyltransferase (adenine-specific)